MAQGKGSFSLVSLSIIAIQALLIFMLYFGSGGESNREECIARPQTVSGKEKEKEKDIGIVAPTSVELVPVNSGSNNDDKEDEAYRDPHQEYDDGCPDGYHLSYLLSRYIDIDFIDFVLGNHPKPQYGKVVDIGIYEAKGLIHMARMGFNVEAYEANPNRYNACMAEIRHQPAVVQQRIQLKNLAVSDSPDPMCFQLAGLDSHMYKSEGSKCHKEKSVTVNTIPMRDVVAKNLYFVKIDTQGFDTRLLEQLLDSIEKKLVVATFIQFEFTPWFEVTRAGRTKEDHKKVFRRLQDAGYDLFQGGALQPWKKNRRAQYGKTPLALVAIERHMPTCVDEFVDRMHDKDRAVVPGKTSTDFGMWMDILAVKRLSHAPYYRHTGWVLSRSM
jgi:FkbM family methyltransferase